MEERDLNLLRMIHLKASNGYFLGKELIDKIAERLAEFPESSNPYSKDVEFTGSSTMVAKMSGVITSKK